METLLKSLGDEKRCEILRLVWSHELPAATIAAHFPGVTRSAISQHLGVLRRADLVRERREGPRRLYSANQVELARAKEFLDSFWTSSLEKLKLVAEAAANESGVSQ